MITVEKKIDHPTAVAKMQELGSQYFILADEFNRVVDGVNFAHEQIGNLLLGIQDSILPTMNSSTLNSLNDANYIAALPGTYQFSPAVSFPSSLGWSNNEVAEGYYVVFSKRGLSWSFLAAVKMPEVPIDEIEEEIELVRAYSVKKMLMNADFQIKDNVALNSDGIPQSYNITWADGEEGEVVLSNYDSNVLEYKDMTATYKNLEVVYGTKTYNNDGYVISQLDNVINEL